MKYCIIMTLVLALALPALARHDPLTNLEVDQLRDATQDPPKRLKLFVIFARARMQAIEQARTDPKLASDRGKQMHDLIEDFDTIAEELDDNIDMYSRQRADLRKPLKEVITAYSEWQTKLKALKEGANAQESKQYEFALQTAIETVDAGADSSRELLDQQTKAADLAKHKK